MGFPLYEPDEAVINRLVMDDPLVVEMKEIVSFFHLAMKEGFFDSVKDKLNPGVFENYLDRMGDVIDEVALVLLVMNNFTLDSDDDTTLLIYSDWLEENGFLSLAEDIRIGVEPHTNEPHTNEWWCYEYCTGDVGANGVAVTDTVGGIIGIDYGGVGGCGSGDDVGGGIMGVGDSYYE